MPIDKPDKKAPGLIPPHGGYRELKSYQNAEIVHDAAPYCIRLWIKCVLTSSLPRFTLMSP